MVLKNTLDSKSSQQEMPQTGGIKKVSLSMEVESQEERR